MSSTWSMTCDALARSGTANTPYDALLAGSSEIEAVCLAADDDAVTVARLSIDGAEPVVVRIPAAAPAMRREQVATALEQLRDMWMDNHLSTDGLAP